MHAVIVSTKEDIRALMSTGRQLAMFITCYEPARVP